MKPEDLTPAQATNLFLLGSMYYALLIGSISAWVYWIARRKQSKPFQTATRPLATAGFVDVVFGLFVFFALVVIASQSWIAVGGKPPIDASIESDTIVESLSDESTKSDGKPVPKESPWKKASSDQYVFSGVLSIAQLLAAGLTAGFVLIRTSSNGSVLGLRWRRIGVDCAVGFWVLLLILPPLLILSASAVYLSGVKYEHPIIDAMKNYPWLFGVVAWQALIVAPITEEFLFRTLLIGWFESCHYGRSLASRFLGWKAREPDPSEGNALGLSKGDSANSHHQSVQEQNPYEAVAIEPSSGLPRIDGPVNETDFDGNYSPPWWPAIVSGALFGLAHFSYGVSWVPLVAFGILLGRVYQLRQSLIMCIAIHMIFNGINLTNLWLSLGLPTVK